MNKKTYTLDEYDEATLSRYNDGVREGMALCSDITHNEIQKLKQSVDDVMCIYMQELMSMKSDNQKMVNNLQMVYDALALLSDRFQDAYFTKLDSLKDFENSELECK